MIKELYTINMGMVLDDSAFEPEYYYQQDEIKDALERVKSFSRDIQLNQKNTSGND